MAAVENVSWREPTSIKSEFDALSISICSFLMFSPVRPLFYPSAASKADSALLRSSLFHHLCRFVFFSSGGFSVGAGDPLPRPRTQVVHGTVPQKCARNTLPARSGILYRPASEGLRCHPLPTSSTRAPEVTPN